MSTFDDALKDIKSAKDAIDGVVANQNPDDTKSGINIQPKDTSKGHFYVSLVKSFIRVGAGAALIVYGLPIVGGLFIAAEALGIIEELV